MKNLVEPTNNFIKVFFILFTILVAAQTSAQQLAFPSAYGAGAYVSGGRGGTVIHVTNLNDNGPGSFREAIESNISPKYIVFDVSGAIYLNSPIYISPSGNGTGNFTVNGFSAPLGGITFRGHTIRAVGLDNQIWRGIRFRNGHISQSTGIISNETCLATRGSKGVIVDRCSFAYARSKGFSNYSTSSDELGDNTTVQNSLFGQSAQVCLLGNKESSGGKFSFLRNVMSQVGYRTPNLGGNSHVDIINNYTFNWTGRLSSFYYNDFSVNLIGNKYHSGVNTNVFGQGNLFKIRAEPNMNPSLYLEDNFISEDRRPSGFPEYPHTAFGLYSGSPSSIINPNWFKDNRLPFAGRELNILPPESLAEELFSDVGACYYIDNSGNIQYYRDSIDEQLINLIEIDAQQSSINSSQYPILATNLPSETRPSDFYISNPHIPEAWFLANVPEDEDHNTLVNGYTWLEVYLNQIDYIGLLISAESVAITSDSTEMEMLSTLQLGTSFTPSNTTNQEGVWSSSNEFIATVDSSGLVTANEVGDVTITFIANDGGHTDTIEITVFPEALVASAGSDQSICEGESITLTASGGTSYLWNTGETSEAITVAPDETSTYSVLVSDDYDQSEEVSVQVIVNEVPIVELGENQNICEGESIVLTANGGSTYLWSTGETTSSIEVTPDSDTTYDVEVFSNNCSSTDSVVIFVRDAPDITVSDDIVIVEGESTTLAVNGSDNYLWSTGETTAFINVTPTITTIYDVSSISSNGCSTRLEVTVTVIPEVNADAGSDITICRDEIVTLTATGGGTYLWNTGDITEELVVSPIVTTTYTVTVEDDYGYTDSDTVTVTVNETPDITVSNDIVIIEGESTTLTASGSDNYLWNTGDSTSSITVNPITTTTYTVVSVAVGGCADIEQVIVTVIPEVLADAGEDIEICSGETTTLNASGGTTYLWNTGDTEPQLEVSPLTTTTYTVIVEDDYGYTDTDSVTITVNQTPDITVSNDIQIMDGESTTLTANGGDNYIWNTNETSQSIVVSPTITTIYSVSSIGEGGCEDIEQVTVTVIPEVIANAGEDTEICSGEIAILNASGGTSYLWSTGDTTSQIEVNPLSTTTYSVTVEDDFGNSDTGSVTVTVNQTPEINVSNDVMITDGDSTTLTANGGENYLWNTGQTDASITVSPTTTTTYSVSSVGVGGCEDIEQVTVTVIPEVIAYAGEDVTICNGESTILNATGGTTYLWNTGEATAQIEVSPLTTTTYTITVENDLGYTDTDSVTVIVNEAPSLNISQDITIIEGESTSLVVSGAETYIWNNGATFNSIIVSPLHTTTYIVNGTTNSCTAQAQVTVTVEDPFFASAGQDERVCSNDNYEVVLTAGQGDSYLWNTGETSQSITVSPLSTTTYTVTVTQGAQEDTDDVTVYVDPNPDVVIVNGESVNIMNGDFITLSATGANTYEWNNGATQPNIAVSPSSTTTYEVKGYIGDCYDDKQVTVNVIPEVEADAGDDVTICLDEFVTLTATGGDEYEWSTGETTQSIEVSPSVTTQYTVTVFNALDFDEDSVIVTVDTNCENDDDDDDSEIEIPIDDPVDFDFSVFPNPASDIVNIKLSGSTNLTKIYLYDITGKLIYKSRVSNENLSMSSTTEINVSKLLPGIYHIKMVDITKEVSKKLIVN